VQTINVSIIVNCFNKEPYLDDCISSILRQTKQPKSIVVVHDSCSNVGVHLKADNIVLKENHGVARARHEGFRFTDGSLVLFVDGDDVLSPDYLEKMTLVIAKGADIAYPDLFIWSGKDSRTTIMPKKIDPKFVQDKEKVVIPVTCLMKREVYEKVGGFREWSVLEDVDFWIRAMCSGYIFKKAETLLWYRQLPDARNKIDLVKRKEVLTKILAQFTFTKDKVTLGGESLA
jgi:glycosyltransferase involved in cell wall biosynthesis